jgi:hypothetical protein
MNYYVISSYDENASLETVFNKWLNNTHLKLFPDGYWQIVSDYYFKRNPKFILDDMIHHVQHLMDKNEDVIIISNGIGGFYGYCLSQIFDYSKIKHILIEPCLIPLHTGNINLNMHNNNIYSKMLEEYMLEKKYKNIRMIHDLRFSDIDYKNHIKKSYGLYAENYIYPYLGSAFSYNTSENDEYLIKAINNILEG